MPTEFTLWGTQPYSDGIRIPMYRYKCKSASVKAASDKNATTHHTCKCHIDHDGGHICICGVVWPNKADEKAKEETR